MAKDVRIVSLCDPCDQQNFTGVEAVGTHVLSMNGGPPKEVDMCARDEALFLRVYSSGREIHPPPPPVEEPTPAKKPKAKAVKAAKPKELPVSMADAVEKVPTDEGTKKVQVQCLLDHAPHGGPKMVTYSSRAMHAKGHDDRHVWDIPWADPAGVLTSYCTEHELCKKNNLGFTSQNGLSQHSVLLRNNPPTPAEDSDGQTHIT
jgi:hypothetical protein